MFIIIEIIIARETIIGVTRYEALFSIRNCLTLSTKAPYDIRAKNYKSTPTTCFNLLLPLATHSADPSVVSRVRYGGSGAPKNTGSRPHSPPRPTQRPAAGRVFGHSLPPSPPRPPPRPSRRRVPVKNRW